jgi:hypothetical protein
LTNHFDLKLSTKIRSVHRYDVEMTLVTFKNRPPKKRDTDILLRAFEGQRHILNFDPPEAKLSPSCPPGVKFSVRPSILLNSRECSPLGVNEGVNIPP